MKFDRQIATVLNLAVPPFPYELRTYEVEEVSRSHLQVSRTYSQTGGRTEWHECIFVGPRGGCKTIYKNFW